MLKLRNVFSTAMAYKDYKLRVYHHVSLRALTKPTLEHFSRLLDPACTMLSKQGLQRDWQGLAELMGYNYEDIQVIHRMDKQTVFLIKSWSQKVNSNLGQLAEMIEQLERYDVLEDAILEECIARDVAMFDEKQEDNSNHFLEVNSLLSPDIDCDPEYRYITVGDVKNGRTEYFDAMVNYHEDDIEFVNNLEKMLESELGVKLFRRERDQLIGCPNESTLLHIMEHRVKAMILVLSSNFLKSDLCEFLVKCALVSKANIRVLPIIIQQGFKMPTYLLPLTNINYTRPEQAESFWKRIRDFFRNLKTPQEPEEASNDLESVEKTRSNDDLAATCSVRANIAQSDTKDYFSPEAGDVLHQSPAKSVFPFHQKKPKHSQSHLTQDKSASHLQKSSRKVRLPFLSKRKTLFGKRKAKKDDV